MGTSALSWEISYGVWQSMYVNMCYVWMYCIITAIFTVYIHLIFKVIRITSERL